MRTFRFSLLLFSLVSSQNCRDRPHFNYQCSQLARYCRYPQAVGIRDSCPITCGTCEPFGNSGLIIGSPKLLPSPFDAAFKEHKEIEEKQGFAIPEVAGKKPRIVAENTRTIPEIVAENPQKRPDIVAENNQRRLEIVAEKARNSFEITTEDDARKRPKTVTYPRRNWEAVEWEVESHIEEPKMVPEKKPVGKAKTLTRDNWEQEIIVGRREEKEAVERTTQSAIVLPQEIHIPTRSPTEPPILPSSTSFPPLNSIPVEPSYPPLRSLFKPRNIPPRENQIYTHKAWEPGPVISEVPKPRGSLERPQRVSDQEAKAHLENCCRERKIGPNCMGLCNYQITKQDIIAKAVTGACSMEDAKVWVGCVAAGERNAPCCSSRGATGCDHLCNGEFPDSFNQLLQCVNNHMDIVLQCHRMNLQLPRRF